MTDMTDKPDDLVRVAKYDALSGLHDLGLTGYASLAQQFGNDADEERQAHVADDRA